MFKKASEVEALKVVDRKASFKEIQELSRQFAGRLWKKKDDWTDDQQAER